MDGGGQWPLSQQAVDVEDARGKYEDVDSAEKQQRQDNVARRQRGRGRLRRAEQAVNHPGLPAHLGGEPASERSDKAQREGEKDSPEQPPPRLQSIVEREPKADPREKQHDDAAAHHDAEGKEGNPDWWPILGRNAVKTPLSRAQTVGINQAAEGRRQRDCEAIASV